jgi:hypothetical protein
MRLFSLLLLRGDRHLLPRCSSLPRLLVTPLVFNRRAPSFVHVHLPSTDRTDAALMIGRPMRFNVADHFNAAGRADRHGPLKTARPRVKLNPPKRRLAYTCETCSCKSTLSHGHAPPWRRGPCDTERASRRRPARQLWRVAVGCPRLVCPHGFPRRPRCHSWVSACCWLLCKPTSRLIIPWRCFEQWRRRTKPRGIRLHYGVPTTV